MTYHRTVLATDLAQRLLHPGPLDRAMQSGLFLSAPRRVGKTTFLKTDLIPALEAAGALVIYADLWSQPDANPAELVYAQIRRTFSDLESPKSAIWSRLKKLSQAEVGLGLTGFKFSFKLDQLGQANSPLPQAFTELVDQVKTNVVLILDEVQHALASDAGNSLLQTLKAVREAVNMRPGAPGRFYFIGTGSHRAQVQELVIRGNQAFQGAVSQPFPVLGKDFVAFVLEKTASILGARQPSLDVAYEAFQTLGHRPEELNKALATLAKEPEGLAPDRLLPTIARALRASAADVELVKLSALGELAGQVFGKICGSDVPTKGLFTGKALTQYAEKIGRSVTAPEVQSALTRLLDENLVMRMDHGRYDVADPFVKTAWQEYQAIQGNLDE